MAFVAIYDANVLYPSTLRDVLIRVAQAGLVQAKWTDQILDETFRNLKENRPDLDPRKLDLTRDRMAGAIRDVLVKGYEPLIDILDLPDPGDRHVLAAAIRAKAQVIVTSNLRDFPAEKLSAWDVQAVHPDAFIEAQVGLSPGLVYAVLAQMADVWRKPPNAVVADVIDSLEREGLVASAAALRALT
ncbi:PIN domain-containing protein [Streptomyces lasiicapitis]|uniref:PIN domain-containing protein n=1 Tax=Streptomyces lasiicapitis TaxID=1923961 RepID=A0ABQ2M4R2_9ACTN|nr:PIN domain-containing protein [Streptomyces lasiicapitis]GGO47150.1 PIN domain-containing protein [Streptomyces lasiicapitis]